MSNKGISQSIETRKKISLANAKDRTKIDQKVKEYIKTLPKSELPSITDCAIFAGISEKRLMIYEATTPEDSEIREALDLIRDKQKSKLIKGGLNREYDSKIATLLLTANHNIRPEPTQLTQNNTFNVSPEILAEALTLSRKKPLSDK